MSSNEANTNDPQIIVSIKDEHKYTLMLLSVLREQLAEFHVGKTPDYQLMYDIMHYMANFPEKFNHPIKEKLIQLVIDKDPENNTELESLLAEKRQIVDRTKEVIAALKGLLKEETILKEEQLKIFSKNYVELIEAHIETESQLLFSRARNLLSPAEFDKFAAKLHEHDDHDLATLVEERYKELSDVLQQRKKEWETAANEFALAEFVSMGAFFESLEPLSIGATEISKIVKEHVQNMYVQNYECYKSLLTTPQEKKSDYIEKPWDCIMTCYKEYVNGINKIGSVLKQTTEQIYEPYESRKEYYSNQSDSEDNSSDTENNTDEKAAKDTA